MTKSLLFIACNYLLAPALFAAPPNVTQSATSTNATGLLTQLSTAFSGGNVVHQVQLTGSATWQAGSLNDAGSATLNAASTGLSQVQLSLAALGTHIEAQSGQGTDIACTWTGNDGVSHNIDPGNCWKPLVWFLPAISLQPSSLPTTLGALDLGSSKVGFSAATYRHLQTELVLPNLTSTLTTEMMQRSTVDVGLDPVSLLPAVLSYSIRPDNGAPIDIAVEIHYSNYKSISGVQIPFTIERYVNGTLQLEVTVSSAQAN
jgi:hypothetical protein